MVAVALAPAGVATAITTVSSSSPCSVRRSPGMMALSDDLACSLMRGNRKPLRETNNTLSITYVFNPNMLYNVKRLKCSVILGAVTRSGQLLHCLGTDGSFGSACTSLEARGRYRRRSKRGCECFGSSVADVGSAALAMEWRPAVEQLMLVTSVALAYVAGIVTPKKPAPIKRSVDVPLPQTGSFLDEGEASAQQFEREPESIDLGTEVHEGDPWGTAQAKLGAALSRLSRMKNDVAFNEFKDRAVRNPVLSLQALGAGSRLRLLARALEHLHTQVDLINESSKTLPSAEWSKLTLDVLCGSVEPICRAWLAQEPCLVDAEQQRSVQTVKQCVFTTEKSSKSPVELTDANSLGQGRSLVLDYLQRTGKTELYTDLLFYLRFQTMRPGACCDYTVMSRHVGNALEDLVVALADGAAAIYLGRDPQIGGRDDDWPILVRPSIKSTRSLERFRNEIALQSWFQRNYMSVVAMFEDRFELWTIERLPNSEGATQMGSQQLTKDDDLIDELKLKRIELPARRGKELRALTGWRYFYSLYLEFSDIVGPLLRVLVKKLGEAVSFLLVRLIGRSLGLIFEGIRQSVRWSSK
ncbi:hypothetical protein M758_12G062200 [Ceratodon purpureus]|nr:hypothetical protein M758_12G062200 [Ceratodon purpureus]